MTDSLVGDLRAQLCLHPTITNLNWGSCAMTSRPLLQESARLRAKLASDPVDFVWREMPELIEASRQALADYLNAPASDLIITKNATFAINMLLQGIEWPPDSEVLISDQEYDHYYHLWRRIAREHGVTCRTVTLPKATVMPDAQPEDIVTAFAACITEGTTHIFCSHVTSPTGLQLPVQKIVKLAHQHQLVTIVDGAHAPGQIPVDLKNFQVDYYFGNIHKWLMGIPTAGFLYIDSQRETHRSLKPLITTRYHDYDRSDRYRETFAGGPSYFAAELEYHGTEDRIAQALITQALQFRRKWGEEWILNRLVHLSDYAYDRLYQQGYDLVSFRHRDMASAMITFRCPKVDTIKAWYWFREHGFDVMLTSVGSEKFIRLSTAAFLRESDIDQFIDLLSKVPWSALT